MTASLIYLPLLQFLDATGVALPGAKLYSFLANSSTPAALYADAAMATPLSNPAVADSQGKLLAYMPLGTAYKLDLFDQFDVHQAGWPVDGVSQGSTTLDLAGYSATVTQMRLTHDPGEVGSESLATTMAGELERLRFSDLETKRAMDPSIAQWYETPAPMRWYNVLGYGVVGDGVTDDSTALNALLTTVGAAGGGRVYFPTATYYITTSLLIPSNTLLCGNGSTSIIKMGTGQTNCALVNSGQPTSAANGNISITDLAIDGNRATPAGSFTRYEANIWNNSTAYTLNTYVANSTAGFRIYKVITAGTTSGAGTGPTSTASDITDGTCHFQYVEDLWTSTSDPTGHQAPILLSRVTNCLVDNVLMYMSRDNGAIFELCQGAKITNCHLRDINKNGIYFSDNEHSVCSGNTVEYSYGGFAFACEWYSALTDNVGRSCINYLISLGRDSQYCTITGNVAGRTASGAGGLGADGDLLVTAESITGTTHGKTYAGSSGDYYYGISHSVIATNDVTRIQLQFSDGNLIAHNVIQNARRDGLHLLGCSQNLLLGNKVYNGGSTTLGPWAYANLESTGGALQGTIQSVQNRWYANEVHDDRDNDGTVRWGFTLTGSPAYIHLKGNMVTLDNSVSLAARFYNWNVDYGVFEDNYWNGTKKFLLAGLPTAREELRGDLFTVNGGAGVLDLHYLCQKLADDSYEFKRLALFVPKASFTITGTGFGSPPTATAVYEVVEDVVQLYIPQLSDTSNATTFTLTGMPAALAPSRTRWLPVRIADNGTDAFGLLLVTASSTTLTLYPTAQSGSLWTNSGTKTLYAVLAQWTIGTF